MFQINSPANSTDACDPSNNLKATPSPSPFYSISLLHLSSGYNSLAQAAMAAFAAAGKTWRPFSACVTCGVCAGI